MSNQATSGRGVAPWAIVAQREIIVRLTNKAFIISTIVMIALIGGMFGLQTFLAERDTTTKVVVTDQSGAVLAQRVGDAAHATNSHQHVVVSRAASVPAAEDLIRRDEADVLLTRSGDGWQVVSHKQPDDAIVRATTDVVRSEGMAANAAKAGTSVPALLKGTEVTTRSLDSEGADRSGIGMVLSGIFGVLLMMSAMTFGMQIAASIVEEKASRVVEIVVAAIPVRQLLAGKVLGNAALAVGQVILFVAVGLVGVSFTDMKSFVPSLASSSGWFVVFFLAGFLALATLFALAGALATRNEDLQSTTSPLTSVIMVAYMAGFMAKGVAMTALSFVPIVSTVLMPVRLFTGDAPWWQAVLALVITVGFAVGAVLFGEKLYRRSLLQTQGKLSVRQAMRLED